METELDQTFQWQSMMTQIGDTNEVLNLFSKEERTQINQQIEEKILIPFLDKTFKNMSMERIYERALIASDGHERLRLMIFGATHEHKLCQKWMYEICYSSTANRWKRIMDKNTSEYQVDLTWLTQQADQGNTNAYLVAGEMHLECGDPDKGCALLYKAGQHQSERLLKLERHLAKQYYDYRLKHLVTKYLSLQEWMPTLPFLKDEPPVKWNWLFYYVTDQYRHIYGALN